MFAVGLYVVFVAEQNSETNASRMLNLTTILAEALAHPVTELLE